MDINVQEPDAPFAFEQRDKSAFLLHNIGDSLLVVLILLFLNKLVKQQVKAHQSEVDLYDQAVKAKAKLKRMKSKSRAVKKFKTRKIEIPELGDFTWFCLRITRMLEWYGMLNIVNLVYMQFAIFSLLQLREL